MKSPLSLTLALWSLADVCVHRQVCTRVCVSMIEESFVAVIPGRRVRAQASVYVCVNRSEESYVVAPSQRARALVCVYVCACI